MSIALRCRPRAGGDAQLAQISDRMPMTGLSAPRGSISDSIGKRKKRQQARHVRRAMAVGMELAEGVEHDQIGGGRSHRGTRLDPNSPRAPPRPEIDRSKNPITGIADCCARAASGHAAAKPPESVKNSRRLIQSPRPRAPAARAGR
jgi:hypothetical protein